MNTISSNISFWITVSPRCLTAHPRTFILTEKRARPTQAHTYICTQADAFARFVWKKKKYHFEFFFFPPGWMCNLRYLKCFICFQVSCSYSSHSNGEQALETDKAFVVFENEATHDRLGKTYARWHAKLDKLVQSNLIPSSSIIDVQPLMPCKRGWR